MGVVKKEISKDMFVLIINSTLKGDMLVIDCLDTFNVLIDMKNRFIHRIGYFHVNTNYRIGCIPSILGFFESLHKCSYNVSYFF